MQKLLTKELEQKFLKCNYNEDEEIAIAHFFSCYSEFESYVIDAYLINNKWHLYGYQSLGQGFEKGELASINEMEEINLNYAKYNIQMIERDTYFVNTSIKELIKKGKIRKYFE